MILPRSHAKLVFVQLGHWCITFLAIVISQALRYDSFLVEFREIRHIGTVVNWIKLYGSLRVVLSSLVNSGLLVALGINIWNLGCVGLEIRAALPFVSFVSLWQRELCVLSVLVGLLLVLVFVDIELVKVGLGVGFL
jgi:hypothetical protein